MPTWQQEMGWYCGTCKKLNRGRYKECQNCGKPKEGEPFVDLPGEGEGIEWAVKDPELIKQAKAGSDWECSYCHSHQRRDSGECANCGSRQGDSRDHKTKWDDGTEGPGGEGLTELEEIRVVVKNRTFSSAEDILDAVREAEEEQEVENNLEAVRGMGYRGRRRHKGTDSTPPTTVPTPPRPWQGRWWSRQRKVTAGVMLGVSLVGLLLFLLFRTRIVDAAVTSTHWQYTVNVERYQIVRDEGFDESRPGDAFDVLPLGMRHHHYKQVQDGTRQESYTVQEACGTRTIQGSCRTTPVRCTSNNNGFKSCSGGDRVCDPDRTETKYCTVTKYRTVPKYKDVSVERMWYAWKVWRWKLNRTIAEQGDDLKPFWPSDEKIGLNKNLGAEAKQEREQRETKFTTVFTDKDGDTYTYSPKGLNEYQSLPLGTKKKLKVRIAGAPEILPDAP